MSYPRFYHPERIGSLVAPQAAVAVESGREARMIPSEQDETRTILLLVDPQIDFIHPDGSLSVPGAVDDTRRTVEWIFRNAESITTIAASLDSHVPIQIFSPTWWSDKHGWHPAPYTTITSDDVHAGRWKPLYERGWSEHYVELLEEQAKKALMIWPYHTLIGTPGHSITPALYEAIAYHSAARRSQPEFLSKGSIPKTEHYSIMEPEVKVPDNPMGTLNTQFLDMLASYDQVFIAGQAKSHCVLETVTSMMRYFGDQPEIISKVAVLMDCTSSVAHPEIDFDSLANQALEGFARQGLHLIDSTHDL